MAFFPFSIFSPSRNITLFLHGAAPDARTRFHLCLGAMGQCGILVEQAGFADLDNRILTMAGGEFCVNASRAFGVLLHTTNNRGICGNNCHKYEINVSGLGEPVLVEVEQSGPSWFSTASFPFKDIGIVSASDTECLVIMPGITHLLIKVEEFPDVADLPHLAAQKSAERGISNTAHGIVWWRAKAGQTEIRPYVSVPDAGTAMLESACGSASLALAHIFGKEKSVPVTQPCGEILLAGICKGVASVGGLVERLNCGKIWLD